VSVCSFSSPFDGVTALRQAQGKHHKNVFASAQILRESKAERVAANGAPRRARRRQP